MTSNKQDKEIKNTNDKDNGCRFSELIDHPCNYSVQTCSTVIDGCNKWEKHYGTDCGEMMICCLPFTFVIDTIVLPISSVRYIIHKCRNTK